MGEKKTIEKTTDLVGANTGGLEGLATQLLVLIGDKVAAEGELVDRGTLAAKIEDTDLVIVSEKSIVHEKKADLGVGDTTVVPALGVRLVFAVAVATGRSAAHLVLSEERVSFCAKRHPPRGQRIRLPLRPIPPEQLPNRPAVSGRGREEANNKA